MRHRPAAAALWLYLAAVVLATQYPLRYGTPNYFREAAAPPPAWHPTDGMVFAGIGRYSMGAASPEVGAAIRDAGAFYVYLEASSARPDQYGPSRLFAYSRTPTNHAIMVGQHGPHLIVRVRQRSVRPPRSREYETRFPDVLASSEWQALLLIGTGGTLRVYRNGALVGEHPGPDLHAVRWSRNSFLVAGNEAIGDRGWHGRLRRVELGAGPPPARILAEAGVAPTDAPGAQPGPEAVPLFDLSAADGRQPQGWHGHVADVAGGRLLPPWSLVPFRNSDQMRRPWVDWSLNVLLFLPFGWLLTQRGHGLVVTVVLAACLSAAVESGQVFLPTRTCDATDLLLNTVGAWAGALAYARRRAKADAAA